MKLNFVHAYTHIFGIHITIEKWSKTQILAPDLLFISFENLSKFELNSSESHFLLTKMENIMGSTSWSYCEDQILNLYKAFNTYCPAHSRCSINVSCSSGCSNS